MPLLCTSQLTRWPWLAEKTLVELNRPPSVPKKARMPVAVATMREAWKSACTYGNRPPLVLPHWGCGSQCETLSQTGDEESALLVRTLHSEPPAITRLESVGSTAMVMSYQACCCATRLLA